MCKQTSIKNSSFSVQWIEIDAASEGQRIDNFLIKLCKGVPKSHLYKALRSGQVRVNKGRVNTNYRLSIGDVLRIPPLRTATRDKKPTVPKKEFPIVYEDDALLVVNKPAGVAVHGGSGVSFGVIEQLRAARPEAKFLELAHRLDKETSGLLIVAKKRSALVALHDIFRQGQAKRHYVALVLGDWLNDRQHIKLPLIKYLTPAGERRVRVDKYNGKFAHTVISKINRYGQFSLLDCELKTGRTHQIRVHLASLGFPIVGDDKYGRDLVTQAFSKKGFKRMFLHACQLELSHPITSQTLSLKVEIPPECEDLLNLIAQDQINL